MSASLWKPVQLVLATPSDDIISEVKAKLRSNDGLHVAKFNSYETVSNIVTIMHCTGRNRYRCKYTVKIEVLRDGSEGKVFEKGQHNHENLDEALDGMPPHQKAKTLKGVRDLKRPREIYEQIVHDSPTTKTCLAQVQRATHRLRKKVLSMLPTETVGALHSCLMKHEIDAHSDQHFVGVLSGWIVESKEENEKEEPNVVFTVTTKRLLYQLVEQDKGQLSSFVDADATYNLVNNAYKCLVFGTVDARHSFRIVGLAVSKKEDHVAFGKCLESIQKALKAFYEYEWNPSYVMADSAGAIHLAFSEIFPDAVIGKCFFHVKQGIRKHKSLFANVGNYENFSSDVTSLASLGNAEEYDFAWQLFKKRWRNREPEVYNWFQEHWGTERNRRWNVGSTAPGLPQVNNSLESKNRYLKLYVTKKQRLNLGIFMTRVQKELAHQSLEAERKGFPLEPENSRAVWVDAQLWLKSARSYICEAKNNKCYVPSSVLIEQMTSNEVRKELRAWRNQGGAPTTKEKFKAYIQRLNSFYELKLLPEENGIVHYSCSCAQYFKYAICKHSLGLTIHFQKKQVPPEWVATLLSEKGKVGRPTQPKHCLQKA
jgi:hypothetical protein